MTNAQFCALTRLWAGSDEIIGITYTAYFSEESSGTAILRVTYRDLGGNYHSIGFLPNGGTRTYE